MLTVHRDSGFVSELWTRSFSPKGAYLELVITKKIIGTGRDFVRIDFVSNGKSRINMTDFSYSGNLHF